MSYFARRIQLEAIFGDQFRFQSAEFGEERPTIEEAIKAVEESIEKYTKEKSELKRIKILNQLPF